MAVPGGDGSVSASSLFMRLSCACYSNINNQASRNDTQFWVVYSSCGPQNICFLLVLGDKKLAV